jgi:hypothetical protein
VQRARGAGKMCSHNKSSDGRVSKPDFGCKLDSPDELRNSRQLRRWDTVGPVWDNPSDQSMEVLVVRNFKFARTLATVPKFSQTEFRPYLLLKKKKKSLKVPIFLRIIYEHCCGSISEHAIFHKPCWANITSLVYER